MISYIVATTGRPSLPETLRSIECWPGDEIIVVGGVRDQEMQLEDFTLRYISCPPGNDWGHTERNWVTPKARGKYLMHIDDDDTYVKGTRRYVEEAITNTPNRPIIFRMRFPNGLTLWQTQTLMCGNMGTPCFVIPNEPEKLGVWGSFVGGDFRFIESSKWTPEEYVWRSEVIALIGHNI